MLRRRNCCRPPVVTPHTRASQGRRLSDVAFAILAVAREPVEVEGGPSRGLSTRCHVLVTTWHVCCAVSSRSTSIPRAACSSQWGRGPDRARRHPVRGGPLGSP